MNRTMTKTRAFAPGLIALGVAGLVAVIAMGGCSGHGKYTSEGMAQAQERMSLMRSATEWDMARQAYLAGDLDKALKSVDRSITINPTVAKSHVLRGRILIEKGDLEAAMASLQTAEALDPKSVDAQYYLGIVEERFGQREKALARYQRAGELEPGNVQYTTAAAEMLMDLGRLEEADEFLTQKSQSHEHNAAIRQTQAHVAMQQGEYTRAAEFLKEARLLASDDPSVLEDLVRAQIAVERFAEAEFNITQLQKVPTNQGRRDLKYMRAQCLVALDRPVEARTTLVDLTSDAAGAGDIDAWILLGEVSVKLGDLQHLKPAWQRTIALDSTRAEGYTLKAIWHLKRSESAEALEALDKAIEMRKTSVEPLVLKGLMLEDAGRFDDAEACYFAALAENPEDTSLAKLLQTLEQRRTTFVPEPVPGSETDR